MEFTAQQIAAFVGGKIEGNPEATVRTFSKIEEGHEGSISFLSNPKYTHYLYETSSSVVLVNDDDYTTINKFVKARKASINRGWVFGGPGAVNAATYGALIAATRR